MTWAQTLMPMAEACRSCSACCATLAAPHKVAATAGQFQQSLPPGRVYQLLRMRIDPSLGLIPEISGHRLMISIRLMRQDEEGRLKLAQEDTSFELALCQ